jgi:hypothetical protein
MALTAGSVRRNTTAATAVTLAALAISVCPPRPAGAAPAARSAILPGELAGGDVLPVSRRKSFVVPHVSTDAMLVFAPYTVNEYRTSWARSRSRSSRRGDSETVSAEGNLLVEAARDGQGG